MATEVEEFLDTQVGGFIAGVGAGVLLFCAVRFTPGLVVRAVLTKAPTTLGGKIGSFIVEDASIGRVPLLNLESSVNAATIAGTVFTTSFYLFGGMHTLIEMGKSALGIPIQGTGLPDEVSVAGESSFHRLIYTQSEFGRLNMSALNGASRDP